MRLTVLFLALCLPCLAAQPSANARRTLTLAYEAPHWLIIRGPHLPEGHIRINYLEAYCRAGSTDADWVQHTVVPHRPEFISLRNDGKLMRLRDTLADSVTVDHIIEADDDRVEFRLTAHNPGSTTSQAHWAQPCVRLAAFTGFSQAGTNIDDYLPKCFVFLDDTLVRMSDIHPWAKQARYIPGQVWCPLGVPRTDVNPRPLSPLVPRNGLIGAFSADQTLLFATAWEPYQELFQGVARCLHSDFRLGGLKPNQTLQIRGMIYLMTNNVSALLTRYTEDFPGHARIESALPAPSDQVVAFYYPWYGNPRIDGRFANWNHPVAVRNEPPRSFPGGEDIGANFYPALGAYSANDPIVLRAHMMQLRQARIGLLCVSWWGKDTYTDRALPAIFKAAEKAGLRINIHLEPFPGRNASSTRAAIEYLITKYGSSSAFHRDANRGNLPMFFVYDSYLTPAEQWATILRKEGARTIRGTSADALVIGLWVKPNEERFMLDGGFDGIYTYFATDGFTYGSTVSNWPKLAAWAQTNDKIFVPCVAPGYIDTRIRPWNGINTREREAGAYYDKMWSGALAVSPPFVGITSFNEWHEGTQIEPALPNEIPGFKYLDYGSRAPEFYLQRTAYWVERMRKRH